MTEYKEQFFGILSDNTYGLCPAPMSAQFALTILVEYLLGEDFYISLPLTTQQANTELVDAILKKYSRAYRKDLKMFIKERDKRV